MAGNYCVASAGQYKALINTEPVFELDLPYPCESPPIGNIVFDGVPAALTLSLIHISEPTRP